MSPEILLTHLHFRPEVDSGEMVGYEDSGQTGFLRDVAHRGVGKTEKQLLLLLLERETARRSESWLSPVFMKDRSGFESLFDRQLKKSAVPYGMAAFF